MTPPSDALEALKPCPFCGNADIKYHGNSLRTWAECIKCTAIVHNQYGKTAREAWNTRADTIAPLARVTDERLREACDAWHELPDDEDALVDWCFAHADNLVNHVELQARRDADNNPLTIGE